MMFKPAHPGEILLEGYVASWAADKTGLAPDYILSLLKGEASITKAAAFRLARHLGTSEAFWLNSQTSYDNWTTGKRRGKHPKKKAS